MNLENNIKKPRILMIIRNYISTPNGTQMQAVSLAKALAAKGCAIDFAVGDTGGITDKSKPEIAPGIPAHILSSPKIRGLGTLIYLFALAVFLVKNRKNYDVYHVFFVKYSAFTAGILKALHKKPVICKAAGGGLDGDITALRKIVKFKSVIKKGLFKIDRIIAVSSDILGEFKNEGFAENKLVFIPNGVDTERFGLNKKDGSKQDKVKLLFVGRLSELKGLNYLLDAMLLIREKIDFHLSIAGTGPLKDKLLKFTAENNLTDRVVFTGGRSDVEYLYKENDIFILPSVSEGLSNSLIEAMSSGMAVISTKVSGSVDIIENMTNGILIDCKSPGEIAKAIMLLVENRDMFNKIRLAARKTIEEKYSMNIVALQYIELYKELILENNK